MKEAQFSLAEASFAAGDFRSAAQTYMYIPVLVHVPVCSLETICALAYTVHLRGLKWLVCCILIICLP